MSNEKHPAATVLYDKDFLDGHLRIFRIQKNVYTAKFSALDNTMELTIGHKLGPQGLAPVLDEIKNAYLANVIANRDSRIRDGERLQ